MTEIYGSKLPVLCLQDKLKYTGKGKPPKKFSSSEEVIKWVSRTEGAIGYIDGKSLNKSVKVVLILR